MRYKHVDRDFDRCDDTEQGMIFCKNCTEEQRQKCDLEFEAKEKKIRNLGNKGVL